MEMHAQGIKPRKFTDLICPSYSSIYASLVELAPFEGLRTISSGGAVLVPPLHEWTQNAFGKNTRVMTATGGTDICSACMYCLYSLRIRLRFDIPSCNQRPE